MGSSATTDGTRFEPSTPGMTTGLSPSIYATRELVVPRSIPTTRPSDAMRALDTSGAEAPDHFARFWARDESRALILANSIAQCLGYVAHEVVDVSPPIKQRNHFLLCLEARRFIAVVPHLPLRAQVAVHVIEQVIELLFRLFQVGLQFGIGLAHFLRHAHLFELHIQVERLFEQVSRNTRWVFAIF